MTDRWVVVCPVAGWESDPLEAADAQELLEAEFNIHPFQGECVERHWIKEAGA